ncbi:MAG TPA: aminotransferase class V-fold PLP-dependent enzyme [Demequinaceae bacterium]
MGDLTEPRVFLDASGSAPMNARTREAFLAATDEGWADPERQHAESRRARALLDGAAQAIAGVLGAAAEHTHFVPTFGLAFDRAIGGVAKARTGRGLIVATAVERKPVLRMASRYSEAVTRVAVDAAGVVNLADFAGALNDTVSVALLQHANQETGVLQPLAEAHEAARAVGVPLIVDATASVGHTDPPAAWDALMADPADWGGPRGVAVIAFRATTRWVPLPPIVTGRVNVAAALAAAVALQEREEHRAEVAPRLAALAARIRAAAAELPDTVVFVPTEPALPHLVTFACARIDGEALATELDRRGFAVGSGSACVTEPSPESHVWEALGAGGRGVNARGVVRVGLPPGVIDQDVDRFIVALRDAVAALVRGAGL